MPRLGRPQTESGWPAPSTRRVRSGRPLLSVLAELRAGLGDEWGITFGGVPLPRQEGPDTDARREGPGPHPPWSEVRTERYTYVLVHPTKNNRYAVVLTPWIESLDGQQLTVTYDGTEYTFTVDVSQAVDLGSEWDGAERV